MCVPLALSKSYSIKNRVLSINFPFVLNAANATEKTYSADLRITSVYLK